MAFIELRGVTKSYRKGGEQFSPLANVDLDLEAGQFFVLLGPSGSGKTTLLNLLAGIDRPDRGVIRVGGRELTAGGDLDRWRAETTGYVFQQANLIPVLTAYENVELPLGLFSLSRAERHARTTAALAAVGLEDRADHYPRQLSGGQEQRVAVARAVVADPPLLLCDEPTGALDRTTADGVLRLLARLHAERNKTIVLVTHDARAASFGTRRAALVDGALLPVAAESPS
jgi:putative ABC transport system ATP-binding protein